MSTPAESMSPAERYAADARRRALAKTELGAFAATVDFPLDDFQLEACRSLEGGHGVLVAAPTGAGKTIVGEFAIHLALSQGLKAFYTTPIKALSNQKYSELAAIHGADRVGLLTGDTTVNGEAPIVVMTTEVLRNMLYADSDTLAGLGYVVMDEVHYLADRFRGAVWEEVIIHLPRDVRLVSLSATVSNAEEFGAWLDTVRGETDIILSEHRPVPLWQHVLVGRQLVDLFATRQSFEDLADVHDHDRDVAQARNGALAASSLEEGAPSSAEASGQARPPRQEASVSELTAVNPELVELARRESQQLYRGRFGHGGRARRREERQRGEKQSPRGSRPGDAAPLPGTRASRPQMVQALERRGLLPAIDFIFSRAGCDAAVQQCLDAGLDLTTPAEKAEIAAAVEAAAADIPPADLPVLGFWSWRDGLTRGLAAHHAGLLPTFKETVEKLFAAGLVKVVFATETLALGINMPAKSVLIEKLEKFNGEAHVDITAGEYTQLTGRAGRRGIDVEGHAVVQWRPGLDPAALAGLASRRTYPLNSSFRPTYNMSINLVAQFGRERARGILESSFAQFQADRSVVGLARQVRSREESLAGYEKAMTCHLGDFTEYSRIRQELNEAEKFASREAGRARRSMTVDSLARLAPGDVVEIGQGRLAGSAVVLNADTNAREPRPQVLTFDRNLRRIGLHDVEGPIEPIARIRIPKHFDAKRPKDRRDLAASLRHAVERARLEGPEEGARSRRSRRDFAFAGGYQDSEKRITELRRQLRAHPCHGCAEREDHARWAERWIRLRKETDRLIEQIQGRTNTIAKTFDRVCEVLESYGCLAAGPNGIDVTASGQQLRRIYGDKDMLTALALRGGAFDDVDAAEIAALVSTLVYQAKREERGLTPKMPSVSLDVAVDVVLREWSQLEDVEEQHRLPRTAEPEFGLVWPIYKWARGRDLQNVLAGTELAAGDFVRWVRQVIDLLDQLADVPGLEPRLSRLCHEAIGMVRRGVVAYSAVSD